MFCTNCGKEVSLGAVYCTQCGTKLRHTDAETMDNAESSTHKEQLITMPPKKCPKCGLFTHETTLRCDCGYDFTSDQQNATASKRAYFIRHWRGELSLPVSYWVNAFLVNVLFGVMMPVIPWDDFVSQSPKMYAIAIIATRGVLAIITVWQLVGTWRSAANYLRQGQSKLWGNVAKIALILGFLRAVTEFVSVGIPQITEYTKIATGEDPLGTYQLRVLRDATELELAGGIIFGLTDDIRRTLDAHPTIRVIHLNSQGGRVVEARKLRDLIESRGLTTYTASGCFSACTLAYAAGRERLIAKHANLGFHQYSFPGIKGAEFQKEYNQDKQYWLARGFTRSFVERAFTTPNKEMWKPTHHELFEAGVITGYPDSKDVAVTGFQLSDWEKGEAEFLKNPLFAALKTYEPKIYDRLVSELRTGLQKGHSAAELQHKTFPLLQTVYTQRLPYASAAALRGFTDLLLEQMKVLYAADPALCYAYLAQEEQGTRVDVRKYFAEDLVHKEFSVMAEVIRSAAGQPNQPPTEEQIESQLTKLFADLTQRHGDDVLMLANPELGKAHKAELCQLTYDLYQTILRLPPQESAPLLRFMFADATTQAPGSAGGLQGTAKATAPLPLTQQPLVPKADSPLDIVEAYYVDLNRHDLDAARGKWKTPPSRLQDMAQLIEWFRIEDIQLVDVDASAAHVAVVVTGKRRDQRPERWGGTIDLEKRAGVWKIVTMPLTKQ